jgi:hypothetical protein
VVPRIAKSQARAGLDRLLKLLQDGTESIGAVMNPSESEQPHGYAITPHVVAPFVSLDSPYPNRAHDLARYLDTLIDDAVASFVEVMSLEADARPLVRSELVNDGAYVLLRFARRRGVNAIRECCITFSRQAVDALTFVDRPTGGAGYFGGLGASAF